MSAKVTVACTTLGGTWYIASFFAYFDNYRFKTSDPRLKQYHIQRGLLKFGIVCSKALVVTLFRLAESLKK